MKPKITATIRSMLLAVLGTVLVVASVNAWGDGTRRDLATLPPKPPGIFSPSNSRTENGGLIAESEFFSSSRCAACHRDTHAAWSQSLHRNSGREPFYRESVDLLLRARGIEFTRHCESCHSPVALFSGALTSTGPRQSPPFTDLDDEGITCAVCHAITETRLDGTGSYTLRRPAILAREDGSPIYDKVTDEQILADIPGHKRAVMRPLMRTPEFCATCHKGDAPPGLNGYKSLKGFSAYDEWQQSGASHETVAPFYRRPERTDCRVCHMPKIESADDRAAKSGAISSHRWLGANTAAPAFYGQSAQVDLTRRFLEANVLNVDIFAIRRNATGELIAPIDRVMRNGQTESRRPTPGPATGLFLPGEELTAEVVVSNRNAAHSFPPELRDLYEAWVEFEVLDLSGQTTFHSGFLKADGVLDESAHVYRSILLDSSARPITRHQVWLSAVKAYDNAIPAGRSDVVRFRFRLPYGSGARNAPAVTLRARVNYRRFNQDYTDYVLKHQDRRITIPVVKMAESRLEITDDPAGTGKPRSSETGAPLARRWNNYAIGLLEQAQYGPAAEAFRRAGDLDPRNPDFLISAALAEMKTERFSPERSQWAKARSLLERAFEIAPSSPRARYYNAILLRGEGRLDDAVKELASLAREFPRDREVQRQLGQTLFTLGRVAEARSAFAGVLGIDPTDAGAYQFLSPIYVSEGLVADAERAHALYLKWRDDPMAQLVASRFFTLNPTWAEERIALHDHSVGSPERPILTGSLAAPE